MNKPMPEEDRLGFEKSLVEPVAPTTHPTGVNVKCPSCKSDVTFQPTDLKFHKEGRSAKCPKCGNTMILRRYVKRG